MNSVVKRRLLRNRHASQQRQSLPWWVTAGVGLGAALSLLGVAAIAALFVAYSSYAAGYVPIQEKLAARSTGLTEIYDRNGPAGGVLLGTLDNPTGQLVNPVPLSEISPALIQATVSTEDNSFYSHNGVNFKGLIRAAWENYTGGGVGSGTGGSSITQQLVKNVYLSSDCSMVDGARVCVAPRTLERKFREIAYALQLEQDATKEQILEWYLNSISYADRYVGIEAAAHGYFRKPAKDLTLAESALLAGIPAAPTAYHPRLNCVRDDSGACVLDELGRMTVGGAAKERQGQVLDLMVQHQRATPEEVAQAKSEVVKVYPAAGNVLAQAWIESQVEPRLVRMCDAGLLPRTPGSANCEESVHSGGYKVTSTLDWNLTQTAMRMMQEAISAGQQAGCGCANSAITTIEPATGQVLVYAPNIDPTYTSNPKVAGNIDQLTEINQPGSSFKPAVYLAWMDQLQKTPLSSIWDTSPMLISPPNTPPADRVTITDPRRDGGNEGLITMRLALGGSQNVPAFRAAMEVGVDQVIAYAKALGITTLEQGFDPTFRSHPSVIYGPSIATGGANVRPFDMAYMNATIANMGYMVGVPTLAKELDMKSLKSLEGAQGTDYDQALQQRSDFQKGFTRLPGTRQLDPVTVLKVVGIAGDPLYELGSDLQRIQVVDPGSVWMLQSVMTDCTARVIIWQCGSSNSDLSLDAFMDGVKIPMGVKTGTQQGFVRAEDTLATWMNGYSRYAATAVWVGNADKSLVRDGPSANYASANTTVRLFKGWMGVYHAALRDRGVFDVPAGFEDLRPANVASKPFQTATTERGRRGGCSQMIEGWQRTDISYKGDCEGKGYVPLPAFKPELALALARQRGIPTLAGQVQLPGGDAVAGMTPPPATTPPPTQPPATQPPPTQTPHPSTPAPPPPTQAPTQAPTAAPTRAPTEAPTQSGGGGSGGASPGSGGRGR